MLQPTQLPRAEPRAVPGSLAEGHSAGDLPIAIAPGQALQQAIALLCTRLRREKWQGASWEDQLLNTAERRLTSVNGMFQKSWWGGL